VTFHDRWVSVHPIAVALTAAAAQRVRADGGEITVDAPNPDNRSLRYLVTMGLFRELGCEPPAKIRPHEPAGRFIPLTQIKSSSELSNFIVEMVPLLHASKEEVEPIQYVISELVRNVIEHAHSPTGAMICAQYYKKTRRLALGVADTGVGVRASLAGNYSPATDLEAVMLALRPGVTGTSRGMYGTDYNAGAGLFFTKGIACASNNLFVLYSGSGFFKLLRTPAAKAAKSILIQADPSRDYHQGLDSFPAWEGTVAGIDVAVEKGRTFAQLLAAIRAVYGIDRKATAKRRFKEPRFV
jgi:hypothetical protein